MTTYNEKKTIIPGCEQSEEAYSIYKKCEERHSRIVNGIYRFAMISVFLLCGIVALLPIIYAIFGTPAPNQWIIPMPMQYAIFNST